MTQFSLTFEHEYFTRGRGDVSVGVWVWLDFIVVEARMNVPCLSLR